MRRQRPESLGELLRLTREEQEMNLTEGAQKLGVARTAYRLWEKNAAIPAPEHWKAIAFWCDAPLATILRLVGLLSEEEEAELLRLARREHRRSRQQ